jgi:hypothetical protein
LPTALMRPSGFRLRPLLPMVKWLKRGGIELGQARATPPDEEAAPEEPLPPDELPLDELPPLDEPPAPEEPLPCPPLEELLDDAAPPEELLEELLLEELPPPCPPLLDEPPPEEDELPPGEPWDGPPPVAAGEPEPQPASSRHRLTQKPGSTGPNPKVWRRIWPTAG